MNEFVRWPRELNALQLQKTLANKKACKLRKHLHWFDSTHAANPHNTCTKYHEILTKYFT